VSCGAISIPGWCGFTPHLKLRRAAVVSLFDELWPLLSLLGMTQALA
jgi:hypothetical protein